MRIDVASEALRDVSQALRREGDQSRSDATRWARHAAPVADPVLVAAVTTLLDIAGDVTEVVGLDLTVLAESLLAAAAAYETVDAAVGGARAR